VLTLERGPIMMLFSLPLAFINKKGKMFFILGVIILGVIVLGNYNTILESFGSKRITRFARIAKPFSEETTLAGRFEYNWRYKFEMIINHPFGVGADTEIAQDAHNNYLKIFLQVGWFGGIIFIYILYIIFKIGFKQAHIFNGSSIEQFVWTLLALMLSMLAIGIPNIPFSYDSAIFFWLFVPILENLNLIFNKTRSVDRRC
jgi:O-antigen ligase